MPGGSKNIWALHKHPSIKAVLLLLQHRVGAENLLLLDEERLDSRAVRVASPHNPSEAAAYIYTYAQREECYGLDLEFPDFRETRSDDQTISIEDLALEDVLEKVVAHLELESC